MKKLINSIIILMCLTNTLDAQTVITLNQPESGNKIHVATEKINFIPNYNFQGSTSNQNHSYIDNTIPGQMDYSSGVFTGGTFEKDINTDLAVGYTTGSHAVTPFGAANYTIPLKLPPGTSSLMPELSISYSSQGGNAELGMGWNINGLSAISRVSKTKYHNNVIEPVKLDNTDQFSLDGNRIIAEIPQSHGLTGAIYYTEIETFSRITSYGYVSGKGPTWFKVETKDGRTIEYGNSDDSKFMSDDGTAVIYWRVNKISDPYGNYIEFVYKNDERHSRIDKIKYTGNTLANLMPYNTIQFYYDNRTDKNTAYVAGSTIKTNYILKKIEVRGDGQIARNYHFKYGLNNYSFLTEVKETGKNGGELNSTIFKYGDNPQDFEMQLSNLTIPTDRPLFSGDFNGDGYSDVIDLEYNYCTPSAGPPPSGGTLGLPTARVRLNNKNNTFSLVNTTCIRVHTYSYAYDQFGQIIITGSSNNNVYGVSDYMGTGKDNLLTADISFDQATNEYSVINYRLFSLDDNNQIITSYSHAGGGKIANMNNFIHSGDFDGDGAVDFFTVLKQNTTPFNNLVKLQFPRKNQQVDLNSTDILKLADADFISIINFDGDQKQDVLVRKGSVTTIYTFDNNNNLQQLYTSSALLGNNYNVYGGDFNGDGKTDLLIKNASNNWNIAYSKGVSFQIESFNFQNTVDVTNHKLMIADFNGDGKSDIFHAYMTSPFNSSSPSSTIKIYYSLGDNNFTTPSPITRSSDLNKEVLVSGDYNGDSKLDFLNRPYTATAPIPFIYFNKNGKELLLEKILNGFNQLTTFTYDYLTNSAIYTKENDAIYPLVDIQLPIPVVTAVTIPDGIGGTNTTSYLYQGAKLHRADKGFLGYHIITAQNNVSKTKTVTQYQFKTMGAPKIDGSKFNASVPEKIDVYSTASGNQWLSTTFYSNTHSDRSNGRFFPYVAFINSTDKLNVQDRAEFFGYDGNGNLINHTVNNSTGTGSTITTNTYEQKGSWIPSSVKSSTTTFNREGPGNTQTSRIVTYDYYANGSIKNITNNVGSPKAVTTEYEYNAFGNPIKKTVSSNGDIRETSYQFDYKGRFIIETTNALGQKSYATYSHLWGVPLSQIGVDGLTTTYQYNEFGSLISTTTPDNLTATIEYAWDLGSGGNGTPTEVQNAIFTKKTTIPGKPVTKTWFDAFSRERKTEIAGFNQNIYSITSYDNLGNIKTQTAPYYASEPPIVTTNTYDNYNKLVLSQNAVGSTTYEYQYGVVLSQNDYPGFSTRRVTKTIATLPDGETKTSLTDAAGKVIEVVDNGGKLEYLYNTQLQLKEVKLNSAVVSTMEYDQQGNQTKLIDPNAGITTYDYNGFGELIYQKDAKNNIFEMVYDAIGRLETKTENGSLSTNYTYKQSGNGINQPEEITYNGISQKFTYDYLGRVTETKETFEGEEYVFGYQYDGFNRVEQTTYPSGFITKHTYNSIGYPTAVTDEQASVTYWQAGSMNAYNQYKTYTLGNGQVTTKTYDDYGLPTQISTSDPNIQNLVLNFNPQNGNLMSRANPTKNLLEEFTYDNLQRLTETKVNGVIQLSTQYQGNGNIGFKTDAGNYTYDVNRKNAAIQVSNPLATISSNVQDIIYTPFNSVSSILENNNELTFTYGADQQRRKMEYKVGGTVEKTTYYFGNYEKIKLANGDETELHYIAGGDGLVAIHVITTPNTQSSTSTTFYTYTDHLGSILTLTDNVGNSVFETNFDAWGRRRNVDNWTYTNTETFVENGYNFSWLTRGYTGHEHLAEFGLINMNGRLYDPILGRMLSPDNYVQDATSTQGYNRYSYVVNNPLKYTDPSGEFLSGIGAAVLGWVSTIGDATSNAVSSGVLVQGAMAAGQVFAMAGITYVSIYAGLAISTSSIPFANTFAIVASSFTSNIGMSTLNGNTSVVVSVGFASYDFDNGKANGIWNWNNLSPIEKIGYGFGALANLRDINQLINSTDVNLYTQTRYEDGSKDKISHSGIVDNETGEKLMSFGPNSRGYINGKVGFALEPKLSTSNYEVPIDLSKSVNLTVNKYSFTLTRGLGKVLPYQGLTINCVNMSSLSLWLNGIPNIGLHPALLHYSIQAYNSGFRPDLFSFYLQNR
ncbi:MAG: VCBS repeat-containing protein [Flavobacteriales bacterium]|nr:VCBS repeat-containing protein [Flavobacteriales bacterium]